MVSNKLWIVVTLVIMVLLMASNLMITSVNASTEDLCVNIHCPKLTRKHFISNFLTYFFYLFICFYFIFKIVGMDIVFLKLLKTKVCLYKLKHIFFQNYKNTLKYIYFVYLNFL